jgi:hypothetical protein
LAYSRKWSASIQNASGAVPPAAPTWSVDQYSVQGRVWTLTVMFGFAFWNSAAICSIAGLWSSLQLA